MKVFAVDACGRREDRRMSFATGSAMAMPDRPQLVDFIFDCTAKAAALHAYLLLIFQIGSPREGSAQCPKRIRHGTLLCRPRVPHLHLTRGRQRNTRPRRAR